MNKLVTFIAVVLTVNLFAAPQKSGKKATKKNTTTSTTTAAPAAASEVVVPAEQTAPASTATEAAPQVNPQPEPQAAIGQTSAARATAPAADAITGTIDLRPSQTGDLGSMRTENYLDIGYKTGNSHFLYEQDFFTNLYTPGEADGGLRLEVREGFFRYKQANLWESSDKVYSLSYELRPYLPTRTSSRDKGMITVVRNYAKFAAKVSDAVTLSLWEIPIVHVYSRPGNGEASQNPGFENRVYLMADWNMTDKLSFSFPLMWSATRLREYNGKPAAWDDQFVWIYPELDYALTNNYTIGLSWYNDRTIMKGLFTDIDVSDALKSGVTQFVFRATL